MPAWLERDIAGNTVTAWCAALAVGIAVYFILLLLRRVIGGRLLARAAGTRLAVLSTIGEHVRRTKSLLLLILAVYAATYFLALPDSVSRAIATVTVVALILQAAAWSSSLVSAYITEYVEAQAEANASAASAMSILRFIGRVVVWSVAALLVMDNLGINITALVAGLGVGGIAIGLAVQRILGDLFSSLAIVLDKPFVVGDFVIFGEFLGTIENIGLKTTRIRSLSGEQIVASNSDLLATRIRNYKRMNERRVLFNFGVVYQTPHEKLERIPAMVKEIIEGLPQTRFDRAHFQKYGDFALIFEVVYYTLNPDYNFYMDTQQAINLNLYKRFEQEGISFAYPTQTLYLQGMGSRATDASTAA